MSTELTNRHHALLRAVGAGRCELICSCEPTLYIDGRNCCDQQAVSLLAHAGLITYAEPGRIGQRVPAALTAAGRALLGPDAPGRRGPASDTGRRGAASDTGRTAPVRQAGVSDAPGPASARGASLLRLPAVA
ncbi:MAG TPA: hypothetical protein VGD67_24700 [Pseudonocardiaceae bacterium]